MADYQAYPSVVYFYSGEPSKYAEGRQHLHVFSNFSGHPITIDGKRYATAEHYFQAKKYEGTPREEQIRLASSPGVAAQMGRDRSYPLRADWEDVKQCVMLEALRAKFSQHDYCHEVLMGTGDSYIEERTKNDGTWGSGSDAPGGPGKNLLGKLLMEVRTERRAKAQ
jgi:ribA/ribD-fused uncharacterized protein